MKEGELLSEVSQIKLAGASRTVRSIKCRQEAAVVQASLLMLMSVLNLEKLVVKSLRDKQLSIHSIQTVAVIKCSLIVKITMLRPLISTIRMQKE
jgi:hypothetical protein